MAQWETARNDRVPQVLVSSAENLVHTKQHISKPLPVVDVERGSNPCAVNWQDAHSATRLGLLYFNNATIDLGLFVR